MAPEDHRTETRDVDPYELLVRWYLRFNGYLAVENFVVHETVERGIRQGGETDVLAVRFPHSRELPGFAIENDLRLLDEEAVRNNLVDFVIAEVKGRRKDKLNKVWRDPPDAVKIERVSYVLRWLGPFADEKLVTDVATELQASHRARRGDFLFRLVFFAHELRAKLSIRQVTFYDIAYFLVHVRAPSWQDRGLGSRSPHDQWHPLVKSLWSIADPGGQLDANAKIQAILERLETAVQSRPGVV